MYSSLDRRHPLRQQQQQHYYPAYYQCEDRAPSAAELLEASKKLYVQTEFLKSHRIDPNAPRLFRTDSEEELEQLYQNALLNRRGIELSPPLPPPISTKPRLRTQRNEKILLYPKPIRGVENKKPSLVTSKLPSAFQPVHRQKTPPRPPKNEALRKRQIELAGCSTWRTDPLTQSLPSYEEFMKHGNEVAVKQDENRPKPSPPPRPSLLKSNHQPNNDNNETTPSQHPLPKPRRRQTTNFAGDLPNPPMTQSTYIDNHSPNAELNNPRQESSHRLLLKSQATSTTNLLARSTPDLSLELLINATSRKIPTSRVPNSESSHFPTERFEEVGNVEESGKVEVKSREELLYVRPLRHSVSLRSNNSPPESLKPPLPSNARIKRTSSSSNNTNSALNSVSRQSSASFPSPDSSKDSGVLCTTPDMPSIQIVAADPDFAERIQRWERRRTVTNPANLASNSTPADIPGPSQPDQTVNDTDPSSKVRNSIHASFETRGQSEKSAALVVEDSDLASSDFTSITVERQRAEDAMRIESRVGVDLARPALVESQSAINRPVTQFERNARVLRWIHSTAAASTTNC